MSETCEYNGCTEPATVMVKNHDEPEFNHRCYDHRQDF